MEPGSLGQLCLQRGLLTKEQVDFALEVQREGEAWRRLGEVMLSEGFLTGTQLAQLLSIQESQRRDMPAPPTEPEGPTPPDSELGWLLKEALAYGAHALILGPGQPPVFHFCGRTDALQGPPLRPDQVLALLSDLPPAMLDSIAARGHGAGTFDIDTILGVRVTVYRSVRGIVAVLQPQQPLDTEPAGLGLPAGVEQLVMARSGLVLVTGPAGSGRASTLNSLLKAIHSARALHIVTVEQPIRVELGRGRGWVTRCAVGRDVPDFASGLSAALRANADVIVLSELSDPDLIRTAAHAAGNGRLVIGLMHTNGAHASIQRVLDAGVTNAALAACLRGIVTQHLLCAKDERGAVLAAELMLCTPGIANLVREGRIDQIGNVLHRSRSEGMARLDDALVRLFRKGRISEAAAIARATDPEAMRRKLDETRETTHAGR